MKLMRIYDDIVLKQSIIIDGKVYLTEDNSIKVITSRLGHDNNAKYMITMAYNPNRGELIDMDTCQRILSTLGYVNVLNVNDIVKELAPESYEGVQRFTTI